jgi:hypothetical protein
MVSLINIHVYIGRWQYWSIFCANLQCLHSGCVLHLKKSKSRITISENECNKEYIIN